MRRREFILWKMPKLHCEKCIVLILGCEISFARLGSKAGLFEGRTVPSKTCLVGLPGCPGCARPCPAVGTSQKAPVGAGGAVQKAGAHPYCIFMHKYRSHPLAQSSRWVCRGGFTGEADAEAAA